MGCSSESTPIDYVDIVPEDIKALRKKYAQFLSGKMNYNMPKYEGAIAAGLDPNQLDAAAKMYGYMNQGTANEGTPYWVAPFLTYTGQHKGGAGPAGPTGPTGPNLSISDLSPNAAVNAQPPVTGNVTNLSPGTQSPGPVNELRASPPTPLNPSITLPDLVGPTNPGFAMSYNVPYVTPSDLRDQDTTIRYRKA